MLGSDALPPFISKSWSAKKARPDHIAKDVEWIWTLGKAIVCVQAYLLIDDLKLPQAHGARPNNGRSSGNT